MTRSPIILMIFGVLFLFLLIPMKAQEFVWPQFRGINCSGVAEGQQYPPLLLDRNATMHWSKELSSGHSSPCIWNEHIFLTGFEEKGKLLKMYCLDRATGEIRWQKEKKVKDFGNLHPISTPANATPATDGDRVVFYFGCYGLACYDFDGNLLWEEHMAIPESRYGMGISPVITGDLIILNCFGFENDPHLSAYNKYDGTTVWKYSPAHTKKGFKSENNQIRPDSYSTPVIYKDRVIIYRKEDVSAYDIKSGKQLWRFVTGLSDAVATPVLGDDILYAAIYAQSGNNSTREQLPDFQTMLEKYDQNHDSLIEPEEVKNFVLYIDPDKGIEFGGRTMDQVFRGFDNSRDGYIEYSEWKAYNDHMESYYLRHGIKAIKMGGKGDITADHFLWGNKDYVSNISSPLYYNDLVYMLRSGGIISCFNAKDGTLLYREKLDAAGAYLASPVAVNGRIYCASHNGVVTVLQAGDTFKVLERSELGEKISATPAFVDNKIYLRTANTLYAFGQ